MGRSPNLLLFVLIGCSSPSAPAEGLAREAAAPEEGSRQLREPAIRVPAQLPTMGPPTPPRRIYAKRFVANVWPTPAKSGEPLGYLRGGAVLNATAAEPLIARDCRRGWYELIAGGFVCASTEIIPFYGRRPPERRPLQPDLSARLPYPYGYSRRADVPVFRRPPTDDEAVIFEGYVIPGTVLPDAGVAEEEGSVVPEVSALKSVPTLASLKGDPDSILQRRMERGFYVSLDREVHRGDRHYFRTQFSGFIPASGLRQVAGSAFRGLTLPLRPELPTEEKGASVPLEPNVQPPLASSSRRLVGFVMSSKSHAYRFDKRGRLKRAGRPGARSGFAIQKEVELRGQRYIMDGSGNYFRSREVRVVSRVAPPEGIEETERWIDVDLTQQSLVAYEGALPIYATLISSGRVSRRKPGQNFATPKGEFRISAKHLTATMDGDHATDGPYSIEDVPYVMFFHQAYALHTAFWHDSFGRPRSHGCINLAPEDARYLFAWTSPHLPQHWHGVYPSAQDQVEGNSLGTRLIIHGDTPKGR